MIYRQTGLGNSKLTVVNTNLEPFQAVAMSVAPTLEEKTDLKKYKENQALYFVSGEFKTNKDGTITRKDDNLLYRDLIAIDIEDIEINSSQAVEIIKDKLQDFKYILYSTISHEPNSPRLRLILEPNRKILKDEYKPTIKSVMHLLQLNFDSSSCTWSQLQGLPVKKRGKEFIFIKQLDGLQYPVQEAIKEDKIVVTKYSNTEYQNIQLSDDDFKEMFVKYLEVDHDNIYRDNDYNIALSILLSLSRDVCYKVISYDVAVECSDYLANGNDKWQKENLDKINHAIKTFQSNPNYFETEKSYSMLDKFRIVDKELRYLVNLRLNAPIESTKELHWRLFNIGEQWRIENTTYNENTGKETIPQMPFYIIAKFLLKNLPIKKGGASIETALLYYYDFSKGIYTANEDYLKTCVKKLEGRYNLTKLKNITEDIRASTPYQKPTRKPYLIAVGNGLFNTNTKQLEPFTPNEFITAKVDTNYTPKAIQNYEVIKDRYFNIDEWLNSIACNDDEIVELFWQLINEAINPNKTRRKIAIMLGSGTNGKSTFRDLIINLIGDNNVATSSPHELQERFGLTALEGKICNYGDEVGTKPLDGMEKLKSISSGESVSYERKSKDVRSYDFKTLLLFNSNEIPPIKEKSQAVLNRFLIIPFNANFQGKADTSIKDEKLKNKIILEYVLYKALHLDFNKFIEPLAVKKELEKYKVDNDSIYSFIVDFYISNNYHHVSAFPVSLVTWDYEIFCSDNGYNSRKRIGRKLTDHLNDYIKPKGYMYTLKNHRYTETNAAELSLYGKNITIKNNDEDVKKSIVQEITD